jgi:hypothetical protein
MKKRRTNFKDENCNRKLNKKKETKENKMNIIYLYEVIKLI